MSSTPCRCAALVAVATVRATMVATMEATMRLTACACVMPQTSTAGEIVSSALMTFSAMKMSSTSQYLSLNQKVLLVRNSATNAPSRIWIAGKNAISASTHISAMK